MIVNARVANVGPAARGVVARLEVGGRIVAERFIDLPRDGGASVSFAAVPTSPTPVPARVILAGDALPGDDAYHLLLNAAPVLDVLLIETRPSPFLTQALSIGDAPHFNIVNRSPARATATDLAGKRLVILADGAFPSGAFSSTTMFHAMPLGIGVSSEPSMPTDIAPPRA